MSENPAVLIVEDDDIIIFSHQKMFETLGVTCDLAMQAQEAITKILNNKYALVLLDLGLGCENYVGFDIIKEIRSKEDSQHPQAIVILTARMEANLEKKALALGANEFIQKTIDHDTFCSIVKKYLK